VPVLNSTALQKTIPKSFNRPRYIIKVSITKLRNTSTQQQETKNMKAYPIIITPTGK
jgi:hypothetical protein